MLAECAHYLRAATAGLLLLIAAPLAGADPLHAFSCGQPPASSPPDRVALRDALLASGRDDARRIAHLDGLERALRTEHFRSGDGVRLQCVGGDGDRLDPVTWQLRLDQLERAVSLSGEHTLTAFEDRYAVHDPHDDRRVADVLVAEAITLPARERWTVGRAGTSLHASETYRRTGAACRNTASGRCSVRVTVDWQLGGSPRQPELVQTRYVNGQAVDRVRWQLGV